MTALLSAANQGLEATPSAALYFSPYRASGLDDPHRTSLDVRGRQSGDEAPSRWIPVNHLPAGRPANPQT